jgi:hypothetical protein
VLARRLPSLEQLEPVLKRPHKLAFGLRFSMSFPAPKAGPQLDEFMQHVNVWFYMAHLESVAHNRRWLAGQLARQGQHDEAQAMLVAAEAAETQLLLAQGALVAQGIELEAT